MPESTHDKDVSIKDVRGRRHCILPTTAPASNSDTLNSKARNFYLCEMELQRIVRTEAYVQANVEEIRERVPFISQK